MTRIERARESDQDAILRLLHDNGLTIEGLTEHLSTALVVRETGEIIGSATLEVYGDGALLRSVAVARGHRGRGLGRELTTAAVGLARELNVLNVFLLTTTADGFFPRFGFERIARVEVPAAVKASVQFTSACPESATVMRKRLLDGT